MINDNNKIINDKYISENKDYIINILKYFKSKNIRFSFDLMTGLCFGTVNDVIDFAIDKDNFETNLYSEYLNIPIKDYKFITSILHKSESPFDGVYNFRCCALLVKSKKRCRSSIISNINNYEERIIKDIYSKIYLDGNICEFHSKRLEEGKFVEILQIKSYAYSDFD